MVFAAESLGRLHRLSVHLAEVALVLQEHRHIGENMWAPTTRHPKHTSLPFTWPPCFSSPVRRHLPVGPSFVVNHLPFLHCSSSYSYVHLLLFPHLPVKHLLQHLFKLGPRVQIREQGGPFEDTGPQRELCWGVPKTSQVWRSGGVVVGVLQGKLVRILRDST